MGHSTRDGGIRTFSPDDTEDEFFIETSFWSNTPTLDGLWEKAKEKWPGIELRELQIEAQHIHTDCLGGGDRYDREDWTNFLKISALPEYFTRIAVAKAFFGNCS